MANQFVSLPVPAGNGAGAAVDVSTFGSLKTAVFSKGTANPDISITLEFSNDVGAVSWSPLVTQQGSGTLIAHVACHWLRARVSNFKRGVPDDIQVGGTDDGTGFAALTVPAGNGVGAPANIAALKSFQTFQVGGGAFRGNLSVELSEDGTTWGEFASFQQGGVSFQSQVLVAQFARVRRNGVPDIDPGSPTLNIGATGDASGGGGGGGNPQRFTYVATGAEGSSFDVNLPAARANALYLVFSSQADVAASLGISFPIAGRTNLKFSVLTTSALTAGDTFEFEVIDPT